jgi:hypothetical protein
MTRVMTTHKQPTERSNKMSRPQVIEPASESGEPLEGSGFEHETPEDETAEPDGEEVTHAR